MPQEIRCSFCKKPIPPGTGLMYVKNDGTIYYYCSKKCFIYHQERRKDPRDVEWVRKYLKKAGIKLEK